MARDCLYLVASSVIVAGIEALERTVTWDTRRSNSRWLSSTCLYNGLQGLLILPPHSCDDLTQRESQTTHSGWNYKSISCQNGSHGNGLKWRKDGEKWPEPS